MRAPWFVHWALQWHMAQFCPMSTNQALNQAVTIPQNPSTVLHKRIDLRVQPDVPHADNDAIMRQAGARVISLKAKAVARGNNYAQVQFACIFRLRFPSHLAHNERGTVFPLWVLLWCQKYLGPTSACMRSLHIQAKCAKCWYLSMTEAIIKAHISSACNQTLGNIRQFGWDLFSKAKWPQPSCQIAST